MTSWGNPTDYVKKMLSLPRWQRDWINDHKSINFSGMIQEFTIQIIKDEDKDYFEKYQDLINNSIRRKETTPNNTTLLLKWGKEIRDRDKKCLVCNGINELNAHHIFEKAKYPNLSLNINNGVTLCKKCHYEIHNRRGIYY